MIGCFHAPVNMRERTLLQRTVNKPADDCVRGRMRESRRRAPGEQICTSLTVLTVNARETTCV
jgi:hypothetical protein